MLNKVLIGGLLFGSLFVVTPALALNGHDAALKCENTPGCTVIYEPGGGITIFGPKGGLVMCLGPKAQCVAGKKVNTNAPYGTSLHLLHFLQNEESAPDTAGGQSPNHKPPKVFNLNDGNDGNSGGGKSGAPKGQGGKPVLSSGGSGGGRSVTPHNFTFAQPKKIQ